MFAYCGNCPANRNDISGEASSTTDDCNHNGIPDYLEERWIELTNRYNKPGNCRDVTEEVKKPLLEAVQVGLWFNGASYFSPILSNVKYLTFYKLVNHQQPWDIKLEESWKSTIGTEFPGQGTVVLFQGHYVTPEILGNYTYGVLGRSYGISLGTLKLGSLYAAGFPKAGTSEYDNEMRDWLYITNGYFCLP